MKWEENRTLYQNNTWQYKFTNGDHYGELEINNVEFDNKLIKLPDETID
ncbi:MAG: hypothetical protein KDH96_03790 [Candidatus Riesia sp.]|nr:hypothetical protein [Candidatus Riesia sp.]